MLGSFVVWWPWLLFAYILLYAANLAALKAAAAEADVGRIGRFNLLALATGLVGLVAMELGIYGLIIFLELVSQRDLTWYLAFPAVGGFVVLVNLLAYSVAPFIISHRYKARWDPELQKVVNKVGAKLGVRGVVALTASMPPNAFSYGNVLAGKYLLVSEELKDMLTPEELEAVVGHELAHHKMKDGFVLLILGLVPTVMFNLGEILLRHRRLLRFVKVPIVFIYFILLMSAVAVEVLVLTLSRVREFYADAVGAAVSSPEAMAGALEKIHRYYEEHGREELDYRHLKLLYTYGLAGDEGEKKKERWFVSITGLPTHPPIYERIERLRRMAQRGPQ